MEVLNTPKFQLRKIQRELIKERDYRDGLEKELANTLALVEQRGIKYNILCPVGTILSCFCCHHLVK